VLASYSALDIIKKLFLMEGLYPKEEVEDDRDGENMDFTFTFFSLEGKGTPDRGGVL
jgi:hypothetical protein